MKTIIMKIRKEMIVGLFAIIAIFLTGCHIEGVLCCDESGLSSGIQQIADGVMDIIDYFD